MFDPVRSNMKSLEKAKAQISNPDWRDIYQALMKCRLNILLITPEEYVTFQVNGEPDLTSNDCGMQDA